MPFVVPRRLTLDKVEKLNRVSEEKQSSEKNKWLLCERPRFPALDTLARD